MQRIAKDAKNSTNEIISKKKATIWYCYTDKTHLRGRRARREAHPNPANCQHCAYGLHDAMLSMPAVVGKDSTKYRMSASLSEDEHAHLKASAEAETDSALRKPKRGARIMGFGKLSLR